MENLNGYTELNFYRKLHSNIDYKELDGKIIIISDLAGAEVHGLSLWMADVDGDPTLSTTWETNDPYFTQLLHKAWRGEGGLGLFIKGEIPVKKKMASALVEGTCILGKHGDYEGYMMVALTGRGKVAVPVRFGGILDAEDVEVIEEYHQGDFGDADIFKAPGDEVLAF